MIGLHAVWTMLDAQRERGHRGVVGVTGSIKGLAGLGLGGLCTACLLFRSKDTIMYHGLAGARAYLASKVCFLSLTPFFFSAAAPPR